MKRSAVAAFAAGPLLSAAIGLVTLPVLSWYFTQGDLGRNSMFQVVVSFGASVLALGLDHAYLRDFHEAPDRDVLLANSSFPGLFFTIALAGVLSMSAPSLSLYLFGNAVPSWFLLTLLCGGLTFASRILSLPLRMRERGFAFSTCQILPKLVFLATIFFVPESRRGYEAILWGQTLSCISALVLFGWFTREDWIGIRFRQVSIEKIRPMLRFGGPLMIAGLLNWALTSTGTVILRYFSTLPQLGLFSVAQSLAGVGLLVQSIFSTIWIPTVYKWASADGVEPKLKSAREKAVPVVCLLLASSGAFAPVASYFLPSQYSTIGSLIPCCLVPPLFYTLSEVSGVGLHLKKRSVTVVAISVCALLVSASSGVLLVPRFEAPGAAVAMTLGYFVFLALRTELSGALVGFRERLWFHLPTALTTGLCIYSAVGAATIVVKYALTVVTAAVLLAAYRRELVGTLHVVLASR